MNRTMMVASAGVVAAVVWSVGVAAVAAPSNSDIGSCVSSTNGDVRRVINTSGESCESGEQALSRSQVGAQGPQDLHGEPAVHWSSKSVVAPAEVQPATPKAPLATTATWPARASQPGGSALPKQWVPLVLCRTASATWARAPASAQLAGRRFPTPARLRR